MSGTRVGLVLVICAGAVVAWYIGQTEEARTEPVVEVDPPVIERGVRTPVEVREPERVEDEWTKKNQRAIRLLNSGDLERAVALFAECVAGDPKEDVFLANLAEALSRLARVEYELVETRPSAIEHLMRAVEIAPGRADLEELLERWLAEAEIEGDFWTDRSAHFLLSYDGDREELLRIGHDLVLITLEDAYAEFADLFGVRPAEGGSPAIEVVLLQQAEFSDLTGLGHWAGGAFDGRIRISVTDLSKEKQRLVRVLRHELVHAFVQEAGGRGVVGWLNEGLAEWLEEPKGASRSRAVERARESAAATELRSLDELGGSLASLGSVEKIRAAYTQSLSFVGWIEHWYGDRVLFQMIAGCRVGAAVEDTFEARTNVPLERVFDDLEQDLAR